MPFGIRRFLFWVPFAVIVHQAAVASHVEVLICDGSVEDAATCYAPIPQAGVAPLIGLPWAYAALDEVGHSGLWLLPSFPYTHAYAPPQPFVGFSAQSLHIGKVIVADPSS